MLLRTYINQELRSDHAGEVGAVEIYRGIKAVALLRSDYELIKFADTHGAVEQQHLSLMETVLSANERSRLQLSWQIAGWLTGAVAALFGRTAVYTTIQAVESFVDQHYQQQVDCLSPYPEHNNLVQVLKQCQADEVHHKEDAESRITSTNAALKIWGSLINIGSHGAVAICRRI